MVHSMTAYGKSVEESDHQKVTTEIRTVNHRFLDVKLHGSQSFHVIEDEVKRIVQSYFTRGRIDVNIHIEGENVSPFDIHVDWNLMDQYMKQIQKVKERYHLSSDIPLEIITTIPDLFTIEQSNELLLDVKELITLSVERACQEAQCERRREGKNLQADMVKRVQTIHNMVLSLRESQPTIMNNYCERIRERIDIYVDNTITLDESRLHQEITLLAEKGDITEEITRLTSHLGHSMELFDHQEPIGRKLDFIVQEIHRELNTIGSKAIDEKMGWLIVQAKSELEKIREQIQNIE